MLIRAMLCLAVLVSIAGCGGEVEQETRLGIPADKESSTVVPQVTPASFKTAHDATVEFNVPDMMCADGCGVAVKEILVKQSGAKDVLVDFDSKTAIVAVDKEQFDADKALAALVDHQFLQSSLKTGVLSEPAANKNIEATP